MKIRDFKDHTFKVCGAYLRHQSQRNRERMRVNLVRWARHTKRDGELADYGYSMDNHESLLWTISYCSDRMNQGRAKATLRLLREETETKLRNLFNRWCPER